MSDPFILIDGYNLLHAAGLARRRYGPGGLERARLQLLVLLARKLRTGERARCTLVFDAVHATGELSQAIQHYGITVRFPVPGQDADTAIEQLIVHHASPRQLVVVSSDHRLHRAARRRGAIPLDSEVFLQFLEGRESISPLVEVQNLPPPAPRLPSPEEWQVIFGDIDVRAIEEEIGLDANLESLPPDLRSHRLDSLQKQLDDPHWVEQWLNESTIRWPG